MPDNFSISGLRAIAPVAPPLVSPSEAGSGEAFESAFASAIARVDQFRLEAEGSAERFMRGENEEVHQVVLAAQRAEIAFETFLGVRNKVVSAYQEIMRMQL